MPKVTHAKRGRIAITAAIASFVVASFLIFHHRSQPPIRTFTFPANVTARNITWIDSDNFLTEVDAPSGNQIWSRCNLKSGKSYPIAKWSPASANDLFLRITVSRSAVSPDGKFIAGSDNGYMPWVAPLGQVLQASSLKTPPMSAYISPFISGPRLRCVYWLPGGQYWINQSLNDTVDVYNHSGVRVSRFAVPSQQNFKLIMGETYDHKILFDLYPDIGLSPRDKTLISIDERTGKSTKNTIPYPPDLYDAAPSISLSPRGDRLAWLGTAAPHDWAPVWLHKLLLKSGVDTTPKRHCLIIVTDLQGRNPHTVLDVRAGDAISSDFGWLPDGQSVYLDETDIYQSGQMIRNTSERITQVSAN